MRSNFVASLRKRGMRNAGASPTPNRIIATCGPESRADASFAANAIAPNIVAEASMRMRARLVARRSLGGSGNVSDVKTDRM